MSFRPKGVVAALTVMMVLVSGTMLAFSSSAAYGPPADEWTVALYIAADNNLEWAWDHYSLRSLLKIPESDDVNFVAMVDRLSTSGTELLEFSGDSYEVVMTYPEMDTSDGASFEFFLEEVSTLYPADNMCVVAWDHGGSWLGFCTDDTDGTSVMRLNAFGNAVINAGVYIDIFVLDACIVSTIEVIYEAATTGLISYVIASEMYVPYDGLPYDDMFAPLAEDSSATVEEVSAMIMDGYYSYYHCGRSLNFVLTDVMAVGSSMPVFQTFSDVLTAGLGTYDAEYATAVTQTETNDYIPATLDLYDLCENLMAYVPDEAIADACLDVMAVVDTVVLDLMSSGWAADMHGLSIWWMDAEWTRYLPLYFDTVHFAEDSGWGDFLTALYV